MIPLTCRSHYSLLRATADVSTLCRRARSLGYPALGLTDTNNLHGLWPFLATCRREGLTPVVGAELVCGQERLFCLVRDTAGYRSLCRLLTACGENKISLSALHAGQCRGLFLLVDDNTLLARLHERGLRVAAALVGRPGHRALRLYRLARRLGIMAVALPDVFFAAPEEYVLHRLQRAIALRTTLSRLPDREVARPDSFLAPAAVYEQRFAIWPETVDNSHRILEECSFRGPEFGTVLPPYRDLSSGAADALLRRAALAGARSRYGDPLPAEVRARLERELAVIADRGFSSYFLVVRDIVEPVSRTCGRGSAAASLVAYCLRITNVCPLRHNLYFERFLNPGRPDPPDIDIDFAWDERDRILAGVLEQYGAHAAMVCSLVRLQPRMAIRETARVFGLPGAEIRQTLGRLQGLSGRHGQIRADRLSGMDLAAPWPEILRLAGAVSGMVRHVSVHSGGVVITPRPVSDYVPVQRAARGVPLIQWDKDGAEAAGLVKIDLLGNRSLAVIRDTLAQMRENGVVLRERDWRPEDDTATRKTVAAGATMGCFYIESPAMRLLQKKAGRGDFEHLVIHSSLIRPAANNLIREYLRRLHGGAWQPLHPLLADVLESYGILVFQEDVARVAVRLGFSHAEADRLRRIMAKKARHGKLADHWQRFSELAGARGVSREKIRKIWEMMLSFEGYSFCKAHSASYAMVSFQAAWLKTRFPAEFMAAVLSNQGGYYSTFAYVSEARRLGLRILPPDVNQARVRWQGQQNRLRVGLMAVRHLGRETMARIVAQAPFASVHDFLDRVRPHDTEACSLIHAGALDSLAGSGEQGGRAALLWRLRCWQSNSPSPVPAALPSEDRHQRLRNEYRALGFLCALHPLALIDRSRLPRTLSAAELADHVGRRVWFLGWPLCGKVVATARGEAMEFFTFEDESGQVECTFFPGTYHRCGHLLRSGRPLLLAGTVEEEFGAITLTVQEARPVRSRQRQGTRQVGTGIGTAGAVCPAPCGPT